MKATQRVIVPLTVDQVARFWSSFRTSRDLAIVGLMLLHGLRSCEVLALDCEDVQLAESEIRVCGKGTGSACCPWRPNPSNSSITTCVWNAPSILAQPYSFVSKDQRAARV